MDAYQINVNYTELINLFLSKGLSLNFVIAENLESFLVT